MARARVGVNASSRSKNARCRRRTTAASAPTSASPPAGLTLYAVLRKLQALLAVWTGACHTCRRPVQTASAQHKPQLNKT
ncbi:hypothetical protein ALI144C_01980 [Actinosynnema sp. ALI-1.44]|nr:hypothetical protein ALI144C_01980 [Actinosynnema sp. ALI-1.44]